MAGKITRIIIGVVLLAAAIWSFKADMPWTAVIILVFAILAFFGAFAGKKMSAEVEEKKEESPEDPKIQ
jgi:uncharacterized membrane protein YfcA